MKKLSKEEKKVLTIWCIISLIVFSLLFLFGIKKVTKEEKKYELVRDYNRFYTVNTVLNKYYLYLNGNEYNKVLNMINENYKKNNNIDVNNLKDKLEINEEKVSFNSYYMCSKETSDDVYSYYIKGHINNINSGKYIKDVYYKVVLNSKNLLFDIAPIDENQFGGECHE